MSPITFTTQIKKFAEQGEKTGWTYFEVPADKAQLINPGVKTSYRVKGSLDSYKIKAMAILPMGNGAFIMPLKADVRKAIGKSQGHTLQISLQVDKEGYKMNQEFIDCLHDEPRAKKFFDSLPGSHQRYFSKWIDDAKSIHTKVKRITMAVNALSKNLGYAEMLRAEKANKIL